MATAADTASRHKRARRAVVLAAAGALACGAGASLAQSPLRVTPTLSGELTWTNNVELVPSDQRESDFIFVLTPGASVDHSTARTLLRGSVSLPIRIHARTGDEHNDIAPAVDLFGRAEIVKDFFFIESDAKIQQTYRDPFGARPQGLVGDTANRYEARSYRVTPYIQGEIGGSTTYSAHWYNLWTNSDLSATAGETIYTNTLRGQIDRAPAPFGWGADVERTEYDFPDQDRAQTIELARLRGAWQPDPQFRVFVSGGYERQRLPLSDDDGAIYGLGVSWRPTPRTALDASWEHRFFGASYGLSFNHRTALTVWSVQAARNITSYPEQLARIPAGVFVPGLLNEIFLPRIPDPATRARFIADYIQQRALPIFLSEPLAVFGQRITLQESASASLGLIGARNTLFFSVYRSKTEPVVGTSLLGPLQNALENNTQLGAGAVWTVPVAPSTAMTVSADYHTTEADREFAGKTDEWSLRLHLTRPISAKTTAFGGMRYIRQTSDFHAGYNEFALFVGASHTFR
jgi:uncharacterized protein (PEP-CTERM system associated)